MFRFPYALADGKVYLTQHLRSSYVYDRAFFSNKVKDHGLQAMVYSTATGSPFLATDLFAARLSERSDKWLCTPSGSRR